METGFATYIDTAIEALKDLQVKNETVINLEDSNSPIDIIEILEPLKYILESAIMYCDENSQKIISENTAEPIAK